jgi:hypothetical protein
MLNKNIIYIYITVDPVYSEQQKVFIKAEYSL